jgi:hypothetical protein
LPRFKANSLTEICRRRMKDVLRVSTNTLGSHTPCRAKLERLTWDEGGEGVYEVSYRAHAEDSNA